MASRFVRTNETAILSISDGDTLTVRRRLTSGEQRAAYSRMYTPSIEGTLRVDPLASGIAMITAYLLDWTLCDDQGPVDIKGLSLDDLTNVLDNLDNETFTEIKNAVEAHEAAMIAVRLQEKKDRDGAKSAPETSPSPSDAAGASTGSVI